MLHPLLSIRYVAAASLAVAVLASDAGTSSARPSAATAADSIAFVALPAGIMHQDCVADHDAAACRVKRTFAAADVRAHLATGSAVWRDGDELTFAYRSDADAVELTSGLQYPMSRLVGTDLWVVTIRVRSLDSAVVSYAFIPIGKNVPRADRVTMGHWRGPLAPAMPDSAHALAGRLVYDTLASHYLPAPRAVTTYVPPARGNEPIAAVVYLGDGGIVRPIAPYLDTLISSGRLPRILLVGIESARRTAADPVDYDPRAMEYLSGFDTTNARFQAHEHFFLDEVLSWAERKFGAPHDAARRATFGMSNSGAWAIDMAVRNPSVIGRVIAFSPGGRHGQLEAGNRVNPSARFFLQGGTLEPPFLGIARNWADTLSAHGAEVKLQSVVAGHDSDVWTQRFTEALRWIWPPAARTTVAF